MLVLLRSDLNMPLGKQIAQGAHAACAFLLGCFDFNKGSWRTMQGRELLEAFTNRLSVRAVPDLEFFDRQDALITIEDRGHTVFKGIPTVTAAFFVNDLGNKVIRSLDDYGYAKNSHVLDSPTNTRITQIISKIYRKAHASVVVKQAISEYCEHLINVLDSAHNGRISLSQKEALMAWCLGSFAKITLVASDSAQLEEVLKQINKAEGGLGHPTCLLDAQASIGILTIGPVEKEDLAPITGHLKML